MCLIYHYTSAEGLMGILNKEQERINLWFTDYRYLNDISEGTELKRIFDEVCLSMKDDGEMSEEIFDSIKNIEFDDKRFFIYTDKEDNENVSHIKNSDTETFVCCFCRNGDSLNMWRSYSNINTGYAVGLYNFRMKSTTKKDVFTPSNDEIADFDWFDIIYDDNEKREKIRTEISHELSNLKACNLLDKQNSTKALQYKLLQYKYCFKHSCFASEAEVRCVVSIPRDKDKFKDKNHYKIQYRNRNGMIVPYLIVPFPKEALHSIVVAPTAPEMAEEGIQSYLMDFNAKAKVIRSSLPIRF